MNKNKKCLFLRIDFLRLFFNLLDQLQRITGRVLVSRVVCLEFFLVCLGYLTLESIVLVSVSLKPFLS